MKARDCPAGPPQGLPAPRLFDRPGAPRCVASSRRARACAPSSAVRPNPKATGRREQLRLDGEQLELGRHRARRQAARQEGLQAHRHVADADEDAGRALHARDHHLRQSGGQQGAAGHLSQQQRLHEPVRGRRASAASPISSTAPTCSPPTRCASTPTRTLRPSCSSNGNLQERGMLDGGKRHYAVWHDPHPKPCYLFALVGGDLAPISLHLPHHVGPQGRPRHLRRARQGGARRLGHGFAQARRCGGTSSASGASTTSTCSTSSPSPTSTWARWRTRASTSSTTA